MGDASAAASGLSWPFLAGRAAGPFRRQPFARHYEPTLSGSRRRSVAGEFRDRPIQPLSHLSKTRVSSTLWCRPQRPEPRWPRLWLSFVPPTAPLRASRHRPRSVRGRPEVSRTQSLRGIPARPRVSVHSGRQSESIPRLRDASVMPWACAVCEPSPCPLPRHPEPGHPMTFRAISRAPGRFTRSQSPCLPQVSRLPSSRHRAPRIEHGTVPPQTL